MQNRLMWGQHSGPRDKGLICTKQRVKRKMALTVNTSERVYA